jgi:predicted nuclease of predicted toxin-antitoxin system
VRFLVDAQLPPALARRLEAQGHVAKHVADRGLVSASDDAIRDYAVGAAAVIVTKDENFAVHQLLTGGPAVVWLRVVHGYRHKITMLSDHAEPPNELLPRVHMVASLLKRWLRGTHQGAVSPVHLDYYLDEFTFRFNCRRSRHRGCCSIASCSMPCRSTCAVSSDGQTRRARPSAQPPPQDVEGRIAVPESSG